MFPQISILQSIIRRRGQNVHLVGGFLRDHFLSRTNHDMDFTVDREAIALAREFSDAIGAAFFILDQERDCARVVLKAESHDVTFDFAGYRASTLEEDLRLRDFTVNAFYADVHDLTRPDADSVVQNICGGFEDLKNGIVRRISPQSLTDDPLRLMRAFSLRAQLGFEIETETLAQVRELKGTLRSVSPERIRDELFKVLESPRAAETIRAMDDVGLFEKVIPQAAVMFGCEQGGYHHLDVWRHTLEAVSQFERILTDFSGDEDVSFYMAERIGGVRSRAALTKLGLILHDVGKPETKRVEGGRTSFHEHERVGRDITRHVANLLKLSNEERHALEDMVLWHLRPGYLSNEDVPTERSIYRYFRDTKEEAASILLLSLADQRATRGPLTTEEDQKHHEEICLNLVTLFFQKRKETPFVPLINGHDVMQAFSLQPSRLIGDILRDVYERQALGEISTSEEALAVARKILSAKTDPSQHSF